MTSKILASIKFQERLYHALRAAASATRKALKDGLSEEAIEGISDALSEAVAEEEGKRDRGELGMSMNRAKQQFEEFLKEQGFVDAFDTASVEDGGTVFKGGASNGVPSPEEQEAMNAAVQEGLEKVFGKGNVTFLGAKYLPKPPTNPIDGEPEAPINE